MFRSMCTIYISAVVMVVQHGRASGVQFAPITAITTKPRVREETTSDRLDNPHVLASCACDGPPKQLEAVSVQLASRKFKLIAISVSVDLVSSKKHEEDVADKLRASLKCNKDLVDEYYVVTSKDDKATNKVCADHHGVTCYQTHAFWDRPEDSFNKGAALSELQHKLHADPKNKDAAIMLVDSDICLPRNFWSHMPAKMDQHTLYTTTDRCVFLNPKDYSRGWPAVMSKWKGKTLGMYQMYAAHKNAPTYSTTSSTAGKSDCQFAGNFANLKEVAFVPMHMGSPGQGGSWSGHYRDDDAAAWANANPPPSGACPCCVEEENKELLRNVTAR